MPRSDAELIGVAMSFGPLVAGHFRVIVLESDQRITRFDGDSFDAAYTYAIDTVSEAENDNWPLAWVFNDQFEIVAEGRHYADETEPPTLT